MREAEKAGASATDGLYFLPYLTGERCPYPDPDARGCFLGLDPSHGRGAMTRRCSRASATAWPCR